MKHASLAIVLACSALPGSVRAAEPPGAPAAELCPADAVPRRRSLGRLGQAGVGTLVAGAALTLTGGALLGVRTTRPKDDKSQYRDLRPAGFSLVGVGAAALVTGAALFIADRVMAGRPRRMSWGPVVSPSHAGLRLLGRF